jgi:hypothetical protein
MSVSTILTATGAAIKNLRSACNHWFIYDGATGKSTCQHCGTTED